MTKTIDRLKTVEAIAEAFSVTWKTAKGWTTKPTFPKRTRGGWARAAVLAWVQAWNQARMTPTGERARKTGLECERLIEVIRRERATADQADIEAARLRGELVTRADHTADMLRLCDLLIDGLSTFEQRVASDTRDPRMVGLVQDHVRRIRTELSVAAGRIKQETISIPTVGVGNETRRDDPASKGRGTRP